MHSTAEDKRNTQIFLRLRVIAKSIEFLVKCEGFQTLPEEEHERILSAITLATKTIGEDYDVPSNRFKIDDSSLRQRIERITPVLDTLIPQVASLATSKETEAYGWVLGLGVARTTLGTPSKQSLSHLLNSAFPEVKKELLPLDHNLTITVLEQFSLSRAM